MIAAWLPAVLPAFVAALLLVLPGLIVNLGLGARGFDALGMAPLSSLGVLAFATFLVPAVVGRWSLVAVAVSLAIVTQVAVMGRLIVTWWTGRGVPDRPDPTVSALWRVLVGYQPSHRWWVPRRRTMWWFAAVALAAAIIASNVVSGIGDPDLPSQTIDAGFHYNSVLYVMRSGLADGVHLGAVAGAALSEFYPPVWADVTALTSSLTGVNVAIGASAVGWAIGGVVWPLSRVWLTSRILPHARLITILAVGLCCGAITLFPYLLLSYGVLWPNVLSYAALPAAIGLTLMVLRLMPRSPQAQDDISSRGDTADGATLDEVEAAAVEGGVALGPVLSWWTVLSVGFLGCLGLAFAHPSAIFALGIWGLIGAVMLSVRMVSSSRARGPHELRRSLLLLLLGWSVAAGLWASMSLVPQLNHVRSFKWAALMSMSQAMGEGLTLSTLITKAHWAFGIATLWGFYRLLRVPRLRWLLVSHVALVTLYVLDAGSSTWVARQLTGFFYNDSQRIAALIPMTAVPLAALGITSGADALGRFVGRTSAEVFGRPLSSRLALGIACVALMAVPVIAYPNQGIREGAAALQGRYTNTNFKNFMVTPDEQALYAKLRTEIPAGQTVLGSPFTGAQFSAIWSGHLVAIPHFTSNPRPDVALVSRDFKSFTTDPAVCAALKRLKVGAVVDDTDRFWPNDSRQQDYSGLLDLYDTPGLTPIGYGASATIYRVGPCAS